MPGRFVEAVTLLRFETSHFPVSSICLLDWFCNPGREYCEIRVSHRFQVAMREMLTFLSGNVTPSSCWTTTLSILATVRVGVDDSVATRLRHHRHSGHGSTSAWANLGWESWAARSIYPLLPQGW